MRLRSQGGQADSGDRHPGALPGEGQSGREANAGISPRHQGYLVRESSHDFFPSSLGRVCDREVPRENTMVVVQRGTPGARNDL